jgi:hypothetical protein
MTAEVVPFPATRRVAFIGRMARLLATYRADAAERTLFAQLHSQYEAMLRRGISTEAAKRETRSLELAIRARLWAIVMQGGGDVA